MTKISDEEREGVAQRVLLAYASLPRDKHGAPPKTTALEKAHGVPVGYLKKVIKGIRGLTTLDMIQRFSRMLKVTPEWLTTGVGKRPVATGPIPPVQTFGDSGTRFMLPNELAQAIQKARARGKVSDKAIEHATGLAATIASQTEQWWEDYLFLMEQRDATGEFPKHLPKMNGNKGRTK